MTEDSKTVRDSSEAPKADSEAKKSARAHSEAGEKGKEAAQTHKAANAAGTRKKTTGADGEKAASGGAKKTSAKSGGEKAGATRAKTTASKSDAEKAGTTRTKTTASKSDAEKTGTTRTKAAASKSDAEKTGAGRTKAAAKSDSAKADGTKAGSAASKEGAAKSRTAKAGAAAPKAGKAGAGKKKAEERDPYDFPEMDRTAEKPRKTGAGKKKAEERDPYDFPEMDRTAESTRKTGTGKKKAEERDPYDFPEMDRSAESTRKTGAGKKKAEERDPYDFPEMDRTAESTRKTSANPKKAAQAFDFPEIGGAKANRPKKAAPKAEETTETDGAKAKRPKKAAPRAEQTTETDGAKAKRPKKAAPKAEQTTETDAAKKKRPARPGRRKETYEGDLEAAWGSLEKESRLDREAHDAAAAPVGKHARKPKHAADEDDFDAYLRETEEPDPSKSGRAAVLAGALLAGIMLVFCLTGVQYTRYQTFLKMKTAVELSSFYDGTTVDDIDVSGMTLEAALTYWEETIEPTYSECTITLSNGAEFTAGELGYSSDYVTVLTNAWSAGRSGSLEERYAAINQRVSEPVSYTVTRVMYSADVVAECVSQIAEQIDTPAEDAAIESFDVENYEFIFTDESVGSELDTETLQADMIAALEAGGGTVDLIVLSVQPSVTKEDLEESYGLIAYAVTNASSSSSNRLSNIKLACSIINGTCLAPGETFSFNDVVGERTTEAGFLSAPAYSGGKTVNEVGGGICQVSTTLFNAAVKADMEIVERHSHSMTVSYVDKGKDAAVDWGNKDLQFTNTSDDYVYICCYVDSSKRVRIGIFGKLLENGEYITVEAETTSTIAYSTEYVANTSLATGETVVTQSGKNGYTATAYKVRWDADGNEISREVLCKSTYKSTTKIIEYGP